MRLRLTLGAQRDMEDLRSYLLPLSRLGAENVRLSIEGSLDLLGRLPRAGRATDIPSIRMLPVIRYPYLIYYALISDEVVVVHIRHA